MKNNADTIKQNFHWARNIRTKTLIYFFVFALSMLAVLWLAQVVFLKTIYTSLKEKQVAKVANQVVDTYGASNYQSNLNSLAYQNELKILVFKLDGNRIVILNSGGMQAMGIGVDTFSLTQELTRFVNALDLPNDTVVYTDETNGTGTMTCGEVKIIDGERIYFYVSATIVPVDSTTSTLTVQLAIVTVMCLILAVLISWVMSFQIASPIESLTATAEKMAKGNLNVKFSGKGYNEIDKLSDTLNYATEELHKTEHFRRDLLANVSHELRTPLTMITAYAEMIQDISGDDKEKRNAHLQVIIDESERLRTLVNDILDLSKLQAGVVEYHLFPFDLSQTVSKIVQTYEGNYESYTFETDIDEGLSVTADERRIEQVIYNLVANAVNYAGADKTVIIRLKSEERGNVLYVEDHGAGIRPEDISTIFDRFFRAEQTKRTKKGSGIGLSIVKSVLTAHNFEFGVNSEVGKGSSFFVVFPAMKDSAAPSATGHFSSFGANATSPENTYFNGTSPDDNAQIKQDSPDGE